MFAASVLCTVSSQAQLQQPAPANRPARPQMPASFDRETVAQMLADIDKPYNASLLKVGYFLRRAQPPLPVDEGFELLQTAAQAEPVGTNKWFRLQNLRAFVAFRVPGVDTSQGFEAYQTLFEHAADAPKAKAEYPLRQAILEFVDAVPGRFSNLGLRKTPQTKALLLQAWTAYATALSAPLNGAVIAEPDWTAALQKSESLEAFVPAVEGVLADAKVPKTFGLLVTAAAVLAPQKPGKAIELLIQAKPLIPKIADKADINQSARLYLALVDLLVANDRLPDAIANQREFVQLTGRGQAKLMLLVRQSGDATATQQLLTGLLDPGVVQDEIGEAASGLFKLARDAKTPDEIAEQQAVTLLQTYLAMPRPRDLDAEFKARRSLGTFYLNHQRWDEAQAVLTVEVPIPPDSSPRVRSTLRDLERLKTEAQKFVAAVDAPQTDFERRP